MIQEELSYGSYLSKWCEVHLFVWQPNDRIADPNISEDGFWVAHTNEREFS